jgi:hypothetical protein
VAIISPSGDPTPATAGRTGSLDGVHPLSGVVHQLPRRWQRRPRGRSLAFYETGYVLPTMRQASRRAWRLMQPKECKVFYGFYQGTMQERAMQLMGKKLLAAEALEGKFSSEGLVAMAGDDGIEMALAKSLAENLDEKADRSWQQALDDGSKRTPQPRVHPRKQLLVVE